MRLLPLLLGLSGCLDAETFFAEGIEERCRWIADCQAERFAEGDLALCLDGASTLASEKAFLLAAGGCELRPGAARSCLTARRFATCDDRFGLPEGACEDWFDCPGGHSAAMLLD